MINKFTIGIDTSNYTTSVAAVGRGGEIRADLRKQIETAPGSRGIRQSEALFQHWRNLPPLIEEALKAAGGSGDVEAVSVSAAPEPREGSYMPVFTAGAGAGKILADALEVPLYSTTHQEGHFAAAAIGNDIDFGKPVIALHLSGGTAGLVLIKGGKMETVGGSRDITYGQLLDRCGHALGLPFPSGAALDAMALGYVAEYGGRKGEEIAVLPRNPLCRINRDGLHVNLSGIETQALRRAEEIRRGRIGAAECGGDGGMGEEAKFLAAALMERMAESLEELLEEAENRFSARQILLSGGVSASGYLRRRLGREGIFFSDPSLSCDNAVGVAILGGGKLWDLSL